MQEHAGSDKSCVWHALDFADCELKEEMFAIRFGSVESEYQTPYLLACFPFVVPYSKGLVNYQVMDL